MMAVGAAGVISVVANVWPPNRARGGRRGARAAIGDGARASTLRLLPVMRALFLETNPIPVKAALSMLGFCRDELRLPLLPMTAGTARAPARRLARRGLLSSLRTVACRRNESEQRMTVPLIVCGAAGRMGRTWFA